MAVSRSKRSGRGYIVWWLPRLFASPRTKKMQQPSPHKQKARPSLRSSPSFPFSSSEKVSLAIGLSTHTETDSKTAQQQQQQNAVADSSSGGASRPSPHPSSSAAAPPPPGVCQTSARVSLKQQVLGAAERDWDVRVLCVCLRNVCVCVGAAASPARPREALGAQRGGAK